MLSARHSFSRRHLAGDSKATEIATPTSNSTEVVRSGSRPTQPKLRAHRWQSSRVDDLEASLNDVIEAGAEVTVEPFDFPGGRRFHFREPEGNVLAVWSQCRLVPLSTTSSMLSSAVCPICRILCVSTTLNTD